MGLQLNINRIRWQRAHEVAQGIAIALSREQLPKQYFEAIALNPGDAEKMEAEENARRAMAKAQNDFQGNTW